MLLKKKLLQLPSTDFVTAVHDLVSRLNLFQVKLKRLAWVVQEMFINGVT